MRILSFLTSSSLGSQVASNRPNEWLVDFERVLLEGHRVAHRMAWIGLEGVPGCPGELGGSGPWAASPDLLLDKVALGGSGSLCCLLCHQIAGEET